MKPIQQQLDLPIERSIMVNSFQQTDTLIQRKSKRWASKTVLSGESANLMIAYQMGAKQMEEEVYDSMFDMCDEKEKEWNSCEDCYGCSLYCRMIKLFNR